MVLSLKNISVNNFNFDGVTSVVTIIRNTTITPCGL